MSDIKDNKPFYSLTLVNTPDYGRKVSMAIWILFSLLVIVLFLPWQQNINAEGNIIAFNPENRPQVIPTVISGRIEKWYVQEGQFVNKGDTIIFISEIKEKFIDPEILTRLKEQLTSKQGVITATQQKADALNKQINALKSGMELSLSKAQNKIIQTEYKLISDSMAYEAEKTQYEIAKVQYERQQELYKQGLKSLTELETRKLKFQEVTSKLVSAENKYLATQSELENARIELNSINADYLDKISKAESELGSALSYSYTAEGDRAKIRNELQSTAIRNKFYHILAPQDGYIVKALASGIGDLVKEGEAVVTIMPSDPDMAVELDIKAMDLPLVKLGEKVRVEFDGWPALVFSGWDGVSIGTFGGIVKAIDYTSSKAGSYRIIVIPDKNDKPWPPLLRVGSGVNGWVMLKYVPIWYELWRQLNGFPPKVDKREDKSAGEKKKAKSDEE